MAGGPGPESTGADGPLHAQRLEHALGLAYRHLGRRDRTVAEVRRHLAAKGVGEEIADAAVGELRRQGYLDDRAYAQRFVDDRRRLDGWGTERIARRLAAAGVPATDIEAALAGHDEAAELEAASAVLRDRLARPPADERERSRALGLLVRRGYDLDTAYEAVRAFERGAA